MIFRRGQFSCWIFDECDPFDPFVSNHWLFVFSHLLQTWPGAIWASTSRNCWPAAWKNSSANCPIRWFPASGTTPSSKPLVSCSPSQSFHLHLKKLSKMSIIALLFNDRNEPGRPVRHSAAPSGPAASGTPSCLSAKRFQPLLQTVSVAARPRQMRTAHLIDSSLFAHLSTASLGTHHVNLLDW